MMQWSTYSSVLIPDLADFYLRHAPLTTNQITASWHHLPLAQGHRLSRHSWCETLLNNSTFRLTFVLSKSQRERGWGEDRLKIQQPSSDRWAPPLDWDTEQEQAGKLNFKTLHYSVYRLTWDLQSHNIESFNIKSIKDPELQPRQGVARLIWRAATWWAGNKQKKSFTTFIVFRLLYKSQWMNLLV